MTFSETQMGYNPNIKIGQDIQEPLADLLPFSITNIETEYQEKGSSGNVYRLTATESNEQKHELILKKNEFDYVGFYNDYLKPYNLDSPKVYGYIQQGDDKLMVADYINHEQPDWQNPDRYRKALQWLMHKDEVSSSNLESLNKLPQLNEMQWYGTDDWFKEVQSGYEDSKHSLLTSEFWSLLLENKTRIDNYISELKAEGLQTIVHGDFNMNNVLFEKDTEQIFVIDWTQPHISSGLHDLAHLVDAAPENIKQELMETYRAKFDFQNFDELYKKAETLWNMSYFAWMVSMINEGQENAIHESDMLRVKNNIEHFLN